MSNNYNSRQRAAIHHIDSPLLVLAGAGSGKTTVITQKIRWLIKQGGYLPEHITAVTFTNKAAQEMRQRLGTLLPKAAAQIIRISTFHALGQQILRENLPSASRRQGFTLYNTNDSTNLIRNMLPAGGNKKNNQAEQLQQQISRWKNACLTPADIQHIATPIEQLAAALYPAYEEHLQAHNAFDLDDLILKPALLFNSQPEILLIWQNKIRYLLVDEYQDTNVCQYQLIRLLTIKHRKFTVVGDDDQSIYAWRGAQPENLHQLKKDFKDLQVIKLEQNYRSAGRILKAANQLIANNAHLFEKKLWSELGYGDPIKIMVAKNEQHEGERIALAIQHHKTLNNNPYHHYAILFRSNHQSFPIERALRELNIPYTISGATSFFERSEIRDLICYLRLCVNQSDDVAFLRIVNTPRREIGPKTLEKLSAYATSRKSSLFVASGELGLLQQLSTRQQAALRRFHVDMSGFIETAESDSPPDVAKKLIEELDYAGWLQENLGDAKQAASKMKTVMEFIEWLKICANKKDKTLAEIINDIMLINMMQNEDDDKYKNQVAMLTLHAAKGLEFPHVYIAGMEEELLPHHNNLEGDQLEEERRLAYVGITRAQKTLTLSYANERRIGGGQQDRTPSRFLSELPETDLNWDGRANKNTQENRETGEQRLAQLRAMLGTA